MEMNIAILRRFKIFAYIMALMFMLLGLTEVIFSLPFDLSIILGLLLMIIGLLIDIIQRLEIIIEK